MKHQVTTLSSKKAAIKKTRLLYMRYAVGTCVTLVEDI